MRHALRVAIAFVRKDHLEQVSYRFGLFVTTAGMILTVCFLAGLSSFVGDAIQDKLAGFEGNYLAFLLLGIGIYSYLDTAVRDLSSRLRAAQIQGTLEALLATRTRIPLILLAIPVHPFLRTTVKMSAYIGLGILVFDQPIRVANPIALLGVFALTGLTFGSIGVTFAALTLVFKRTEPLITAVTSSSALLGGVFFPTSILPTALQHAATLLPITPALEATRVSLLGAGSWASLGQPVSLLMIHTAIWVPTSVLVFRWALHRAMRDGSLGQY